MAYRIKEMETDEMMASETARLSKDPAALAAFISKYPRAIEYVANPSPMLQAIALGIIDKQGRYTYTDRLSQGIAQYIDNIDHTIAAQVLRSRYDNVKDLNALPEKLKVQALERNGNRIAHLSNPSKKLQLIAVRRDHDAIKHIENPDEDVCKRALMTHATAARYITLTPALSLYLVSVNGNNIEYITNPSREVIMRAIKRCGDAIRHVTDPDLEMMELAVSKSAAAIQHLDNAPEHLQIKAVSKAPSCFHTIKNPTDATCWAVLQKHPKYIYQIKNPTEEMISYVALVK